MVIFILSAAPVTSVNATRIIAGGPVGISIMLNHSIGSALSSLVFDAMAQMSGMLILFDDEFERAWGL
jgi:hypothetical protein